MISRTTYQNRRKKLFEKLKNNSIAILHSGYHQFRTADSEYPFVVNNNFYYLTGIDQADVTLVIGKFNEDYKEWLFLDEIDEVMAKWVGRTLYKEEAADISGINLECIVYNASFNQFLTNHLQPTRHFVDVAEIVYLDLEKRPQPLYNTFALVLSKKLHKEYPSIKMENLYAMVLRMRMIKDQEEIELICQSIHTTKRAIYNVMNHAKEYDMETMAEAYHNFILTKENKQISFESIIASGKNATILHYVDNNSKIEKDSLLLMDVGCYTNHYSSDISRTFPTSGIFTARQKEIYEIVLDCNKKCIEFAKAGMSWKELNDFAKAILARGCKKLGLIKDDTELSRYYFHSIGHSLGLDVHDPSIDNIGLLEGMVITIEPGLYIEEEGIGIRIEDNIVITKEKAILLSKDIIKEVEDIEKMMKSN